MSVSDALETALQLHQSMDRENAVAIYRDILALQSNHLHALHLLGLAIYQEGNVQEAIPYIQRAVEGNSTDENFQNSLGLCLKQLGRTHEAILHFKKAVKIRPFCVEASLNLGDAWHALGKWEEALHEYQQVVERLSTPEQLSPNHEKFVKDATGRICELLRVVDGWYDAEECLQEAMTKWPTDGSLRNDYGNLLLHAGRIDQALAEYQKAADHGSLRGMVNIK
jgi:Flp pilus assembly protein TadD